MERLFLLLVGRVALVLIEWVSSPLVGGGGGVFGGKWVGGWGCQALPLPPHPGNRLRGGGGSPPPPPPNTPALTLPRTHSSTPTLAPTAFSTASNRPPPTNNNNHFHIPCDRSATALELPPSPPIPFKQSPPPPPPLPGDALPAGQRGSTPFGRGPQVCLQPIRMRPPGGSRAHRGKRVRGRSLSGASVISPPHCPRSAAETVLPGPQPSTSGGALWGGRHAVRVLRIRPRAGGCGSCCPPPPPHPPPRPTQGRGLPSPAFGRCVPPKHVMCPGADPGAAPARPMGPRRCGPAGAVGTVAFG